MGTESLPLAGVALRGRAEAHAQLLVGLDESAAVANATAKGFSLTVYRAGVIPRTYGLSFDPSRINLTIEVGAVIAQPCTSAISAVRQSQDHAGSALCVSRCGARRRCVRFCL